MPKIASPRVAFACSPDNLCDDALVDVIRQSVAILRNRGRKQLAAEALSSELEDLHLEDLSGAALANRATAMAQETGPLCD